MLHNIIISITQPLHYSVAFLLEIPATWVSIEKSFHHGPMNIFLHRGGRDNNYFVKSLTEIAFLRFHSWSATSASYIQKKQIYMKFGPIIVQKLHSMAKISFDEVNTVNQLFSLKWYWLNFKNCFSNNFLSGYQQFLQ